MREGSGCSDFAFQDFLQARLILRDLRARLATRERGEELAESVPHELELERHTRARAAPEGLDRDRQARPNRAVQPADGNAPGRVVFGDLCDELPRAARHPPHLDVARAHAGRPLRLLARTDDRLLPLAVPVERVDVGEDVSGFRLISMLAVIMSLLTRSRVCVPTLRNGRRLGHGDVLRPVNLKLIPTVPIAVVLLESTPAIVSPTVPKIVADGDTRKLAPPVTSARLRFSPNSSLSAVVSVAWE